MVGSAQLAARLRESIGLAEEKTGKDHEPDKRASVPRRHHPPPARWQQGRQRQERGEIAIATAAEYGTNLVALWTDGSKATTGEEECAYAFYDPGKDPPSASSWTDEESAQADGEI